MTLPEAYKRLEYDSLAASLGELAQMIDILDVMPWMKATNGIFNRQFQASRLGTGTFSRPGTGVPTIASTGDLIEEPVKLYEGQSMVDERILQGVDDPWVVRDSEDGLNMEGAFQDWAYNLVYGNDGTAPDNFMSFAARRAALTGYAPYVFSGGAASAVSDAWILELSPATLYLCYPPNSGTPGFHNEDRGRVWSPSTDGVAGHMNWFWARLYQIWGGIVLRNQRALIRYTNLATSGSSSTFSITDFVRFGKNILQNMGRNAFVFVNRTIKGQIEAQAYKDTANGALTVQAIEGYGPVTFIAGIPLRMHEGIPNNLTALS
jgi:hypothetical protein